MLWNPPSVRPNTVVTNHIYDPKRRMALTTNALINYPYIRVFVHSRTRIHAIQCYSLWVFRRFTTTYINASSMGMRRGPMYLNNPTLVRGWL